MFSGLHHTARKGVGLRLAYLLSYFYFEIVINFMIIMNICILNQSWIFNFHISYINRSNVTSEITCNCYSYTAFSKNMGQLILIYFIKAFNVKNLLNNFALLTVYSLRCIVQPVKKYNESLTYYQSSLY